MKNSTKLVLSSLLGITLLVGTAVPAFADTSTTSATSTASTTPNRISVLISALATRFNLSVTDLQKFFQDFRVQHKVDIEVREAKQAEKRENKLNNQLNKAVSENKLTQAQADLVKAELAKIKSALEALKGKTKDEQKVAIKSLRDTEKQWAATNNIPFGMIEQAFVGFKYAEPMKRGESRRGPPSATSTSERETNDR